MRTLIPVRLMNVSQLFSTSSKLQTSRCQSDRCRNMILGSQSQRSDIRFTQSDLFTRAKKSKFLKMIKVRDGIWLQRSVRNRNLAEVWSDKVLSPSSQVRLPMIRILTQNIQSTLNWPECSKLQVNYKVRRSMKVLGSSQVLDHQQLNQSDQLLRNQGWR